MGRDPHMRVHPQWVALRQRFGLKDVQQTAAHSPLVERLQQGGGVYVGPPGPVDEEGPLGEPRQQLSVNDAWVF